jgi:glutaredoxin
MNITIYTSPTCGPCRQIKPVLFRAVAERGWTIKEHDVVMEGVPEGVTAVPTVRVTHEDGHTSQYVGTGEIIDALGLGDSR